MKVGCVKEVKVHEYRVGLTPQNVREYCLHGHEVFIQAGAGVGAGFSDEQYAASGAKVIASAADVWAQSDMIVKVKEPLAEEYGFFRENQIIYTYLHLAADPELTKAMMQKKCKGVAYETIQTPQGLPLLKPMSEIAGRLSIIVGSNFLLRPHGEAGILLGGVPGVKSAKVLILGAGIVGTNALKAAVGLGADVTITDINIDKLTELDNLYSNRIKTLSTSEDAIETEIKDADLVIGSVLIPGASAPKLVRAKYLPTMKPGSVMVDVAIDQGGCFETSHITYHDDPIFEVDGVVHYCVGNMPGAAPRTATIALTNTTIRYGIKIADNGLEAAAREDLALRKGINVYDGLCTNDKVAEAVGVDYTPWQ